MTLASDLRLCSYRFDFHCWGGEPAHVAFSHDCCDRVATGRVPVNRHLDGQGIRDLMALSVESRFGTTTPPRRIVRLTDNGAPDTACETRDFARSVSLLRRNAPACLPDFNRMTEALVLASKRGYVYIADPPDVVTALDPHPKWLETTTGIALTGSSTFSHPASFAASTPTRTCPI